MSNRVKDKGGVNFEDIKINEPNVDIGEPTIVNDSVTISIDPIEYKRKKLILQWFAKIMTNAPVAYFGKTEFTIDRCIDYFYNLDPEVEDAARKTVASVTASGTSCAVLADNEQNLYVCSLTPYIWYDTLHTPDDFSSRYGGLTYLETKGRKYISNLWMKLLITSDAHVLSPIESTEDYQEGNAYYYRLRENEKFGRDFLTYLISLVKMGKLERYVKGFEL